MISSCSLCNNSLPTFQVEKDDPAYVLLAKQNSLDIQLYEYIEELFVRQKALVESYKLGSASSAESTE